MNNIVYNEIRVISSGDVCGVLIGVLILIAFVVFGYFFIRNKFRRVMSKYFGTTDLKGIIEEAELLDQEVPKSLSSMDSIYLEQIKKDFPQLNVNELKRMCEKEILDAYMAIEKKDPSNIKNEKIKSFVKSSIDDLKGDVVSYSDIKFHKTVISSYKKRDGVATIYLSTAFQYFYQKGNVARRKVQDRVKCEYIYVIDTKKVGSSKKVLGLNCPNCGSPITDLGNKKCSYCGTGIVDIVSMVWIINDMIKY